LQYTLTGLFETKALQTYLSYKNIPHFGQASEPHHALSPSYLVSARGTSLHIRDVPQKAGGIFFSIDQRLNDDTVSFRPGGRYRENILLDGQIGTVSDSVTSKNLYDLIAKPFRARFTRVREYLVGPEALALCRAGVRLTM